MDEDSGIKIQKFNGDNYSSWSSYMRAILLSKNVWDVVNYTEKPVFPEVNQKLDFSKRSNIALGLLYLHMKVDFHHIIIECDTAWEAWIKLKELYQGQEKVGRIYLKRQLFSLKMNENENVLQHCNKALQIQAKLTSIGAQMDDEDVAICILLSLPKRYESIVLHLEMSDKTLKTQDVIKALTNEHIKQTANIKMENDTKRSSKAFNIQSNDGKYCTFCKRNGHTQSYCWQKRTKSNGKKKGKNVNQVYRKQSSSSDDECSSEDNNNAFSLAFAITANITNSKMHEWKWAIDSGASHHICKNKDQFKELDTTFNGNVVVANGQEVEIMGRGTIEENIISPSGKIRPLSINNVLYVPKMNKNLLSIPQINKKNEFIMQFEDNEMKIIHKSSNKAIGFGEWHDGLYWLNTEEPSTIVNTVTSNNRNYQLWHERYGHASKTILDKMIKNNSVHGLIKYETNPNYLCTGCMEGKRTQKPFPSNIDKKTSKLFEGLHWDICGPMETTSLGGAKYLLLIIDDFSNSCTGYYLKKKSESEKLLMQHICLLERQFKSKVLFVRHDGAKEFNTNNLQEFLNNKGIENQITVRYAHQTNGKAERMIRSIMTKARGLVQQSNLPKYLWAEACNTSIYLRNRLASKVLNYKTPYELVYQKKPNVHHLRIFGCLAYAFNPSEIRQKWDTRSIKCIFLGYEEKSKAYRLLDVQCNKVILSCDVKFDETKLGFTEDILTEPYGDEDISVELESLDLNTSTNDSKNTSDNQANKRKRQKPEENNTDSDESWTESTNEEEKSDQIIPVSPSNVRRSSRRRIEPIEFWKANVNSAEYSDLFEPKTFKQAMNCKEKLHWIEAMESEYNSLVSRHVFNYVTLPKEKNLIGCKWVYKI